MIPIKSLPDLPWTENSRNEIEAVGGNEIFRVTDYAWQLRNAVVIGLSYANFTSPPWMWFAFTHNVTFRDLIDLRRAQERLPKGTLTAVRKDFALGRRFVEFYGFAFTDIEHDVNGITYMIYRRV